jgi:hypothetical protein
MRRLFSQPLVQFLGIGVLLFALWSVAEGFADRGTERIAVTPELIDELVASFRMTWRRPPTESELGGLLESYLREEVFYREALRMGLDRDDPVIRRRLSQKLEFLSEDLAGATPPTRTELETYLAENPERFRREPRLSFAHVYFSVDRRGTDADADARAVLARMDETSEPTALGDPFVLPNVFEDLTTTQVASTFGADFADTVASLEPGPWQGPIRSGYGLHLVRVFHRVEGGIPPLSQIQDEVTREVLAERKSRTDRAVFQGLLTQYRVTFDWPDDMTPVAIEGVRR